MSRPIPVLVSRENVNDDAVEIIQWFVSSAGKVAKDQPIVEIETSKSTLEITSPADGYIQYTHEAGQHVDVGEPICYVTDEPIAPGAPEHRTVESIFTNEASADRNGNGDISVQLGRTSHERVTSNKPRFSQRAKQLVEKHQLEESKFAETGGLVRSSDVLAHLSVNQQMPRATESAPSALGNVPITFEKLPSHKRRETEYLTSGRNNTLASVVNIVCPTRGLKAAVSSHSKLTGNTTAVMLFETARLLKKFPVFNATYQDGSVGYFQQINIGFAVDAGQGLKVPVIHNSDKKGLIEIAEEMQELVVQYMNDELPVACLTGGTFTLTDLSGESVFSFQPLINRGQSAILGVGSEFFMPGGRDGLFSLILGFDHQLSEGRAAAQFLNELRTRLAGYEEAFGRGKQVDDEPRCDRCLRPASELQATNAHLVHSVVPAGLVCSLCVRGF